MVHGSAHLWFVIFWCSCPCCPVLWDPPQRRYTLMLRLRWGDFTILLRYGHAPRTVANFIRLAEGSAPWVESRTGQVVQKPYYEGVVFHRVISGFMSQTGSRKGDGSDGPGYQFRDELSALTHSGPYVVSMANSGPNTNGGQFFITASTQTQLNNKHSVFGQVILYDAPDDGTTDTGVGRRVCDAINAVETDANGKPLADVVIEKITIRRVGATALAFDEHAQGLPILAAVPVGVVHQGLAVNLQLTQPVSSVTRVTRSTDLQSWSQLSEIYHDQTDSAQNLMDITSVASGQPRLFFYASQVQYDPADILWPRLLAGRTLTVTTGVGTTAFSFTSEDGGTLVHNGTATGVFSAVHISHDGLGARKYLLTNLSNGTGYLRMRLRLSKDKDYPAYFRGRHSGLLILYNPSTGVSTESPTSGNMTLTR